MLSLDDPRVEENGQVVVVLHEFLDLRGEVGERVTSDGVDPHGLGEGDKVGVDHGGVRVSLVVE